MRMRLSLGVLPSLRELFGGHVDAGNREASRTGVMHLDSPILAQPARAGAEDASRRTPLNLTLRSQRRAHFEEALRARVVGQEEAVRKIACLYQIFQAGMASPNRPVGNILLLGPTGSGKTHVVESAADILFGDPAALVKVDCAEFQHSHEISKLIGSPPGYVGHRVTEPLLSQRRLNLYTTQRDPLVLVLFDEIEKASSALWQLLLGVLDKGTLTLGDGSKVDFCKTMLFMTSNLGAREMNELLTGTIGFAPARGSGLEKSVLESKIHRTALEAARKTFAPEFMNRIDEIVVFRNLARDDFRQILYLELGEVQRRINRGRGAAFTFTLTEDAEEFLLKRGFDAQYGARHLKRAIERHVVQGLASLRSSGQIFKGDKVILDFDHEKVRISFFREEIRKRAAAASVRAGVLSGLPGIRPLAAQRSLLG